MGWATRIFPLWLAPPLCTATLSRESLKSSGDLLMGGWCLWVGEPRGMSSMKVVVHTAKLALYTSQREKRVG